VVSYDEMPEEKSMSHETTLIADLSEIDKIYATLLWLSDKVARRLRRDDFVARTISVKVRSSEFETITRDRTLVSPTDQCKDIFETSKKLLPRQYGLKIKVRLIGVKASNLEHKSGENQLALIPNKVHDKMEISNKAVDLIKDKYGDGIIKLAGESL